MKTIMDKFKISIKRNKKILVFLITLGMIALVTGSIFSIMLNNGDKNLVTNYITNFFDSINNNTINTISALKNGLISSGVYVLLVWILGISVIGVLVILFMYFSKLFIIGFSISSIINNYGLKGCLLALSYIFPHEIINIIIYTVLSLYTIKISSKIIFSILKKQKMDFKIVMNKYILVLVFSMFAITLTTLFEIFITPKLIKIVLPLITS